MKNGKTIVALALTIITSTSLVAQQISAAAPAMPAKKAELSRRMAELDRKKAQLEALKEKAESDGDEVNFKDLKSKEISMEINAPKAADIYFENTQRTIEIKTWEQAKIKVVTTVYFEGEGTKLSDEDWFEKLNITYKSLGSSIRLKSGTVSGGGSYSYGGHSYSWSSGGDGGVAVFSGDGQNIGTKSNIKRIVTLYIPKDNKLDIESKYADVSISNPLNKLNADITNGNLELDDVNNLILRSKYANVSAGTIKTGEIDFINGRLTIKEAKDVELDTKYSSIEIGMANKLNFISSNDEYEIDEANTISGRKNYGNLRVTKLTESIEMDGTNADVKIRNIAASVSLIKFDNKYADLRLPLRNVKNYTVEYSGPYSTVYANFEKKPLETKEKDGAKKDDLSSQIKSINRSVRNAYSGDDDDCNCNDKFKATVGDGKGAKVEIKCQNCTVDFK